MAVGATSAANLYNPGTDDSFAAMLPSGAAADGSTTTGAVYAFDTMKFGSRWSLNLGLRYDHFRTGYTNVPAPAPAPTTPVPVAQSHFETSGTLLTGKVGLVFKPLQNGSLYVQYATSGQPPGGANFTLASPAPNATTGVVNINAPNLEPQKAVNIEVGTKWELLDNRLVLTAAAFDTRNRNDLATQDLATGEITQYGERKVRGFELGASGMITPAWQVSAGFSSLDTGIVEGTDANTGAQLQYTPKVNFTWGTGTGRC